MCILFLECVYYSLNANKKLSFIRIFMCILFCQIIKCVILWELHPGTPGRASTRSAWAVVVPRPRVAQQAVSTRNSPIATPLICKY